MALEPAFGLTVGFVLLSQVPTALQVIGITLVVVAGVGAERGGHRGDRPAPHTPPPLIE
jgi:inner membrane transporter RhtA